MDTYSKVVELRARASVNGETISELYLPPEARDELSVDQVRREITEDDPTFYGMAGDFDVFPGVEIAVVTERGTEYA